MYKYEMHLHTLPCSACSRSSIEEMVDAAAANGYAGFVVTNHFYRGNTGIDRNLPWQDFVTAYEQDYLRGKEYAKGKDIDVLFGIESGYDIQGKEILVYGLDPEIVKQMPEFKDAPIAELTASIHSHGGVCYYAHPFRARNYILDPDFIPDPTLVDGVEAYNACNDRDRDEIAFEFAQKHNLPTIAGGDVHEAASFGKSGISTERRLKASQDLLTVLKSGDYKLICE